MGAGAGVVAVAATAGGGAVLGVATGQCEVDATVGMEGGWEAHSGA